MQTINGQKIWIKGLSDKLNSQVFFRYKINRVNKKVIFKAALNAAFQIFINGEIIGAGPMRSAHGHALVNRYDLTEYIKNDDVYLTVAAISYRCNSYYLVNESPFFFAEIYQDNKLIAQSSDFSAYEGDIKVQKTERYCLQRNFAESYIIDKNIKDFYCGKDFFKESETEIVKGNILSENNLSYPDLEVMPFFQIIESGKAVLNGTPFKYTAPPSAAIGEFCIGYKDDELQEKITDEFGKYTYLPDSNCLTKKELSLKKLKNEYVLLDFGKNKSGYIQLSVNAEEDCEIFLAFDEIIWDEIRRNEEFKEYFKGNFKPLAFFRLGTASVVKYRLKKGMHDLITVEPYTLRYLKALVLKGSCVINNLCLRLYENKDVYKLKLKTDNPSLQRVFDASQNTLAQNSVDMLTDCPSRERAGWLCDSFFSARAERLFTGKNTVEKNFLKSYILMPRLKELPEAMLPMCYPSDHINGNYIPNWAMWFVIEINDYFKRTGDRDFVDLCKDKIIKLTEFFIKNYSNSDGLLEKLDKWVFLEWSQANYLVQDVNYPTNMLFYGMLKTVSKLYSLPKYGVLAENIKEKIIKQSFNGEFFEDSAKRDNSGKLVRVKESTETCQYYAFFFEIADKGRFPKLHNILFSEFGPKRDYNKTYPQIHKSNAFIGYFMRLELIKRDGSLQKVLNECIDYFDYMAKRTGTLWEYDSPEASCNHGFTSYVANWIVEGLTGYQGFDRVNGVPVLTSPQVGYNTAVSIPFEGKIINIQVKGGKRNVEVIK